MCPRKTVGVFLSLSVLFMLTTCQLQFNKSSGNSVDLRVVVPGTASSGARSTAATNGKSLTNGTSLAMTITPQPGTSGSSQTFSTSIDGKTTVDFSFSLSSGSYQVLAQMLDASGTITLAQATTKLTVPAGNYPIVLTMYSSLLFSTVFTNGDVGSAPLVFPTFSPTTYSYTVDVSSDNTYLTLTTVDPSATITVTQRGAAISPISGSVYAIPEGYLTTVLVTASNGTASTYAITLTAG